LRLLNKPLFWFCLLAGNCIPASAQIYLNSEYRFGIDRQQAGTQQGLFNGLLLVEDKPYTLSGLSFSAGFFHQPDSLQLAWTAGCTYSSRVSGAMLKSMDSGDNGLAAYSTLQHQYLSADLGVVFHFQLNKLKTRTAMGIAIPVYMNGSEKTIWNWQGDQGYELRDIRYRQGFGFHASQDFCIHAGSRTLLHAGVGLGWISAMRKSKTLNRISNNKGINTNLVYTKPADRITYYLTLKETEANGRINDPALAGFDSGKPAESISYPEPLAYVSMKLGITWLIK